MGHTSCISTCFWIQCLSIYFTRMGKQPLQKHKPNTTGYVTRLLHGRKHTNNTDIIWKNTLNSALNSKQHYKHGAQFFLFSTHAEFKIVRIHKIAKSDYYHNQVCLSVRLYGTTRFPLDGLSWNLIFQYFSNICRKNSSLIKIWQGQRVLHMHTHIHFWSHLAHFFLEWEMFQTIVVAKSKRKF
jgi:hypothetical protein